MKKTFFKRLTAFSLTAVMLSSMILLHPQHTFAAVDDFNLDNTTQIGSKNDAGEWIFYANLKAAGVTPYNLERGIVATGPLSEYYFYNNASPNFSILQDFDLSADPTGIRGQVMSFGNVMTNSPISNGEDHAYYQTDVNNLTLQAKYDLVNGPSGYKDLLRYEYVVTNNNTDTIDIAGIMNGDTALGAMVSDNQGNYLWYDRALVFVDAAEKYTYDETLNPNGFLDFGGQISAMTRFVNNSDANMGINGIPLSWQNITAFDDSNIQTAYYGVKPDQASTTDHFYPLPNLVDFKNYNYLSAPTVGVPGNPFFIPYEKQISGQLSFDNTSPDGVAPAGRSGSMYGDSQTSIQWNKQRLAPGQSVSFVYFIGRGKMDISTIGKLNFSLSVTPGTTFPIINNVIEPMNASINFQNIGDQPISGVIIKLFYDESRITPLDPSQAPTSPAGYETTTLNGVTRSYPYVLTTLTTDIAPFKFSVATFPILGINTTMEDLNTYILADVKYTDENSTTHQGTTPEIQLTIPGKLKEDKSIGFIHLFHKDKETGAVIFEEYVPGIVGDSAHVYSRYFAKYALSDTTDDQTTSQQDNYTYTLKPLTDLDTHTFWYEERLDDHYVGGLIVRHLDADYNNVGTPGNAVTLAIDHVHGKKGSTYTAMPKTWPGYGPALNPVAQTVTFTDGVQVIDYYYPLDTNNPQDARDTYRNLGNVFVYHKDITNNELITRDTFMVDFSMPETTREFLVNHIDIESYLLEGDGQKTVLAQSGGNVSADFFYTKTGFVRVQYRDKDSGNLLFEEYVMGVANTNPTLSGKSFTSYNVAAYPDLSTTTFEEYNSEIPDNYGIPTVVFEYQRNLTNNTGDILITHIEKGNPLHVLGSEHVHGAFGTNYTATPKQFIGYLPNAPGTPVEKTFNADPQQIVFEYEYDSTNTINIGDVLNHDATVTVVHQSNEDGRILAKDTIVVAIPAGATEETASFASGNFMGYVVDGANLQEELLHSGEAKTITFHYNKNTADLITANITFVDEQNTLTPLDLTYTGIPGALVDLRQITAPEGYVLDEMNQGQIVVPLDPSAPLYIKIKPISDALTVDGYIEWRDIRGIKIPGLSYTEVDPSNIAPVQTTVQSMDNPLGDVAINPTSESTFTEGTTPSEDNTTTESAFETDVLPDYRTATQAFTAVTPETPFLYNEKKVGLVSGIPFTLDPPQISNYVLRNSDELNMLFFDSEAQKGYVHRTVYFTPETVSYHLTVKDKNNIVLKEITETVPWGTGLTKEDFTALLQKNGLDSRYVLDDMNDFVFDEQNANFDHDTGAYTINTSAREISNKNSNGGHRVVPIIDPPPKTETKPAEQPKEAPKDPLKENPTKNNPSNSGSGGTRTRTEGVFFFEKPQQILMGDDLIPLSNLLFDGPYIYGYPDGTLHPEASLTRAEAMQMIYNVYGDPFEMIDLNKDLKFKDVSKNAWYANAVAFGQKYGIIQGYLDGTFRPNAPITRAEFAALTMPFQGMEENAYENHFTDMEHHWAKEIINNAYVNHIIAGYDDGTFRPDQQIQRAESVEILNGLLQRPDQWLDTHTFPDLPSDFWAYDEMMNAANGFME